LRTAIEIYLQALQSHLISLCASTDYFDEWSENQVRQLFRLGIDDGNDGLIGVSHFVQHLRASILRH
jgi:hypothetical protein